MFRVTKILSILIILAISLSACQSEDVSHSEAADPGRDSTESPAAHDSLVIEMSGQDSLSVFDILRAHHQVDYFSTAAGVFVRAIDSLGGGSQTYWVYSVNDSMAQVASDRYITRDGDLIRWHFRCLEQ